MRWLVVLIAGIGLSFGSAAQAAPSTPHTLDRAHVLFETTRDEIEAASVELQAVTGIELFVVTVPRLGDRSAREVALDLPVWDSTRDQVVLLLAMNEREVRIEASPSLSRHVVDADWTAIIQSRMLPKLRSGRHGAAVRAGVDAIALRLQSTGHPSPIGRLLGDPRALRDMVFVLVAGLLVMFAFNPARHFRMVRGRW
ncbi:MAG: TPM domain-containing protein [Caulobacterales bacterium]|nr:TPM domain-containing protein [Caulobacterales bacterium]